MAPKWSNYRRWYGDDRSPIAQLPVTFFSRTRSRSYDNCGNFDCYRFTHANGDIGM